MHALRVAIALLLCSTVLHVGCGQTTPSEPPIMGAYDDVPAEIKFLDQVEPQAAPMVEFADLPLTSIDGTTTSLKQIAIRRPLVVVFTRGYNGAICPYCSTQTARLISNYAEFQKRNAEIVVGYPLRHDPARTHVPEILTKINSSNATRGPAPPPLPLHLDHALPAPHDRDPWHRLNRLHSGTSARSSTAMSTAWSSPFTSVTPGRCLGCSEPSRWASCSGCCMPSFGRRQARSQRRVCRCLRRCYRLRQCPRRLVRERALVRPQPTLV